MGLKIPERYRWAVDVLDVQPEDRILEIGCGYGHAIALICEKVESGHLTAIDRSEKMVELAVAANANAIGWAKVAIHNVDLLNSNLPASHFDKIFFFNINAFWMDPVAELAEVRSLLKPDGVFYIFHQPPPGHELKEFANAFRTNLEKNSFTVNEVRFDYGAEVLSVCVISSAC